MIFLSLKDSTLDKILYEALQSEIGPNFLMEEGLGSLGIKARKVELVASPIFPFAIQEIRRIKSFLMRDQKDLRSR